MPVNNSHECDICKKKGPLEEVLWYCNKCTKYYCLDCAVTSSNRVYAQYAVTTYVRCPELHMLGKF